MKNEKVQEINAQEGREDLIEVVVEDYIVSDPDYGELIIEMVHKIDDQNFLCFIYETLNSFKKKWGI